MKRTMWLVLVLSVCVAAGVIASGQSGQKAGAGVKAGFNPTGFPIVDETVTLGPSSHIGHASILHGCTLGFHVLVGMGSIINDHVEIGDESVLGAGCVLPADQKIPPGKLVVGVPGRIIGDVSENLRELSNWGTREYQALPPRCHKSLRRID